MPEYCDGCKSWFLGAWAYDTHHCETDATDQHAARQRADTTDQED